MVLPVDRARLLAETGHHPFVRLTADPGATRAYLGGSAAAWGTSKARRRRWFAFGEPTAAVTLVAALVRRGELGAGDRVTLPLTDHAVVRRHLTVEKAADWLFRWTRHAPPPVAGTERVVALSAADHPEIDDLLDRAFPEAHTRPGDPGVRGWYGIRDGDRLVACAADRSRNGIGSISAVAVDPQARGRGLGRALTTVLARRLVAEHGVASLGVMVDNPHADRLYRRLGFTDALGRTSVTLAG